jgi:hypothetical protein
MGDDGFARWLPEDAHRTAGEFTGEEARLQRFTDLVYELLDAHEDTTRLGAELAEVWPEWQVHVDYLRQLQRVGREMLAREASW